MIQIRNEVSTGDESWLDSRYILEIEKAESLNRLHVVYETKKKHPG